MILVSALWVGGVTQQAKMADFEEPLSEEEKVTNDIMILFTSNSIILF